MGLKNDTGWQVEEYRHHVRYFELVHPLKFTVWQIGMGNWGWQFVNLKVMDKHTRKPIMREGFADKEIAIESADKYIESLVRNTIPRIETNESE